jgi:hypothetical protein
MTTFSKGQKLSAADVYAIEVGDTGLYPWQRDSRVIKAGIVVHASTGGVLRLIEVASDTGNARISFVVVEGEVLQ